MNTFLSDRRPKTGVPCFFIGPHSGENTAKLGMLWDGIALSDSEQEVVDALHIIDPQISKVNMVGEKVRGCNGPRTYVQKLFRTPFRCVCSATG